MSAVERRTSLPLRFIREVLQARNESKLADAVGRVLGDIDGMVTASMVLGAEAERAVFVFQAGEMYSPDCLPIHDHALAAIDLTDWEARPATDDHTTLLAPLQQCGQAFGGISMRISRSFTSHDLVHDMVDLAALRLAEFAADRERSQLCTLTGLMTRQAHDAMLGTFRFDARQDDLLYILIDIDRLAAVNTDFGRKAGDEILRITAERIAALLGSAKMLARVGGDRFAALIYADDLDQDAESIGQRLSTEIATPVGFGRASVQISGSIGIAKAGAKDSRPDKLIAAAERAMQEIRDQGGNGAMIANAGAAPAAGVAAIRLKDALDRGEITAWFQPIYNAEKTRVAGFEALTRWQCANGDIIGPAEFLEPIRRLGLIEKHNNAMLTELTRFADQVPPGHEGLHLAINAADDELQNPKVVTALCEWCQDMRGRGFVPVVEISENTEFHSVEENMSGAIVKLAASGAAISMDDFGNGSGSVSRLLSIPVHQLKIDRRFVRAMRDDPRGLGVIRALLHLAEGLNLETVAEGVETELERNVLTEVGCTYLQGFLFSPAIPALRALAMLGCDGAQKKANAS